MNKNLLNKIALVTGGVLIGSGTTYLITKNRLIAKYDEILADELRGMRAAADARVSEAVEQYKLLHKEPPYDDPRTAVRAYEERLNELDYWHENGTPEDSTEETPVHDQLVEDKVLEKTAEDLKAMDDFKQSKEFVDQLLTGATEIVAHDVRPPSQAQKVLTLEDIGASPVDIPEETITGNVFENFPDEKTPVTSLRDKDAPFLIGEEEFQQNDLAHENHTLIYYAGDDTLADENGGILGNRKTVIGKDALKHFGYISDMPNTLYVRNEGLRADYEVVRLEGTHSELVLGIHPED